MWDIKHLCNDVVEIEGEYYLNHVGYKVYVFKNGRWVNVSYYLNHVGYKVIFS